jgi:aminopeptidase N
MIAGRSKFPATLVELPEAQDSTFEADTMLLMPLKPIDRKSLEVTLAYQLAHQTLWSPRAWIYAGAAHFAQALMRERQDGRAAAIAYMEQRLAPLTLEDSGVADLVKSNSLVNTTSEVFYRTKAMYVWWMLREIVGQRAVLDTLQQYDPDADKEPSYMQKLLEKNSHKDLEWFFDDWVYQDRGLPEFTISNGYARPSLQGIYLVSATVENQGGAAAEVPIIVHTQNGDVPSRIRVPAHGKTALRVEVSSRPLEVTVNDGSVPEVDRTDNTTLVRIGSQ